MKPGSGQCKPSSQALPEPDAAAAKRPRAVRGSRRYLKSSGAIVAGTAIAGDGAGGLVLAGAITKGCDSGPGLAEIRPDPEPYLVDDTRYHRASAARQCLGRARMEGRAFMAENQARFDARVRRNDPGFGRLDAALYESALAVGNRLSPAGLAFDYRLETAGYSFADAEPSLPPGYCPVDSSDPAYLSAAVKRAARFFGADLAGICRLDRRWVYSEVWLDDVKRAVPLDLPKAYRYAIVVALAMDYEAVLTSPSAVSAAAVHLGYSQAQALVVSLAEFIKALGYRAIACVNDTALSVPLAIDAGLGEACRTGLLVTPEFGARVRLAKVITDLPLEPDRPMMFGVRQSCRDCMKCAELCPAQCIRTGPDPTWSGPSASNNPGVRKWYVDVDKCLDFWLESGAVCNSCVAACPYSRPSRIWTGGLGTPLGAAGTATRTRVPITGNLGLAGAGAAARAADGPGQGDSRPEGSDGRTIDTEQWWSSGKTRGSP